MGVFAAASPYASLAAASPYASFRIPRLIFAGDGEVGKRGGHSEAMMASRFIASAGIVTTTKDGRNLTIIPSRKFVVHGWGPQDCEAIRDPMFSPFSQNLSALTILRRPPSMNNGPARLRIVGFDRKNPTGDC